MSNGDNFDENEEEEENGPDDYSEYGYEYESSAPSELKILDPLKEALREFQEQEYVKKGTLTC